MTGELDKRVQTGQAKHRRTKQWLMWTCAHTQLSAAGPFAEVTVSEGTTPENYKVRLHES